MTYELFIGLAIFAFVTSITPGPNNLMLMASGLNYGFRRTLPHMLGVGIGFTLMIFLVGLGLKEMLDTYPKMNVVLNIISFGLLLFLAYKIASSGKVGEQAARKKEKPISFIQAAAFQWTNPKAWVMAVTAISTYAPTQPSIISFVLIALIFGAINLPSVSLWVCLGDTLKNFFNTTLKLKIFNYSAAFLLIATMIPMLIR